MTQLLFSWFPVCSSNCGETHCCLPCLHHPQWSAAHIRVALHAWRTLAFFLRGQKMATPYLVFIRALKRSPGNDLCMYTSFLIVTFLLSLARMGWVGGLGFRAQSCETELNLAWLGKNMLEGLMIFILIPTHQNEIWWYLVEKMHEEKLDWIPYLSKWKIEISPHFISHLGIYLLLLYISSRNSVWLVAFTIKSN